MHTRTHELTSTFQRFVQCLLVTQIGLCHKQITRLNKIVIQGKHPGGKWTRKLLAYLESNVSLSRVIIDV